MIPFLFPEDIGAVAFGEGIRAMKCRICSAPCVSVLVERVADGGRFDVYAGYCARHSEDMKRPLTTEVER